MLTKYRFLVKISKKQDPTFSSAPAGDGGVYVS